MEIAYECDAHTSACSLWRNKPAMEDISVSLPPSDSNFQVKKNNFFKGKEIHTQCSLLSLDFAHSSCAIAEHCLHPDAMVIFVPPMLPERQRLGMPSCVGIPEMSLPLGWPVCYEQKGAIHQETMPLFSHFPWWHIGEVRNQRILGLLGTLEISPPLPHCLIVFMFCVWSLCGLRKNMRQMYPLALEFCQLKLFISFGLFTISSVKKKKGI